MPNDIQIKKRILSLDGGGAKGVYTLGFLSRLEKDFGSPLVNHFDLVYGTSTGSIIAVLISLGVPVEDIYEMYIEHIPGILNPYRAKTRSARLKDVATKLIGGKDFNDLKINTGLVATNWETKKPLIFKNSIRMAHGAENSFIPGFGVSLIDAVRCSCSAVPLFEPVDVVLKTRGGEVVHGYDGGFCANNPSLFSLIDAQKLGFDLNSTALFSVGVGHYPEPRPFTAARLCMKFASLMPSIKLLGGVLETGSNTTSIIQDLIYSDIHSVRADAVFNHPRIGTDLLESDINKLKKLYSKGTQTYESLSEKIKTLT